jgi:hypothetical protein
MSDRSDYIEELHMKVHEYADDDTEYGWHLQEYHGKVFRFPKRALLWYVFGNMRAMEDLLPEYEAFSPSGMKLQLDNRYHTDVMLGAGWDIEDRDFYWNFDSDEHRALHAAKLAMEDEFHALREFGFTILANTTNRKRFSCQVWDHEPKKENCKTNYHIDDVDAPKEDYDRLRAIVIPNASIQYDLAARNADVIITEVGGSLAHLAIVSREKGKILLRVDNAVERFPYWTKLRVDLDTLKREAE